MAEYKLTGPDETSGVVRISDGAFIPKNPNLREWREYEDWKAEGNTPDPQYTLEEYKLLARSKVADDYYTGLDRPIDVDGDMIDLSPKGRTKISMANASKTKQDLKIKRDKGKSKTFAKKDLEDLNDLIDDRDDVDLTILDNALDAIDLATSREDLIPYLPEGI